jgi:hypothetical protein
LPCATSWRLPADWRTATTRFRHRWRRWWREPQQWNCRRREGLNGREPYRCLTALAAEAAKGATLIVTNLARVIGSIIALNVGDGGAVGVDGSDTWVKGATLSAYNLERRPQSS